MGSPEQSPTCTSRGRRWRGTLGSLHDWGHVALSMWFIITSFPISCTSLVLPLPRADLLPDTEPQQQLSPKGAASRCRWLQDKPFICGHAPPSLPPNQASTQVGSTWYKPAAQVVLETEVKVPSQGQLALKCYKRLSMSTVTSAFPSFNRTKAHCWNCSWLHQYCWTHRRWMRTKPIFISAAHLTTAAKLLWAATLEPVSNLTRTENFSWHLPGVSASAPLLGTHRSSYQQKQVLCSHLALHQQDTQLPTFHCLCTAQLCSIAKLPHATTQLPGCTYLLGGAWHVPERFQIHTYALHVPLVTLPLIPDSWTTTNIATL